MNLDEIKEEAKRCLNCKSPYCVKACPLNMPIPSFIEAVREDDFDKANEIILSNSYFGAICGIVCPHERQCQGSCVRGIKGESVNIGKIEYFISDYALQTFKKNKKNINKNHIKVAVIGAGPSGLACGASLRDMGYDVTIFEKNSEAGGILLYGIPEFRLDKNILKRVVSNILSDDISLELNKTFGKDITVESLKNQGYKAIYLAIGCEKSKILDIPGNNINGVYGANEFLNQKIDCTDKNVIVIGGGNVAIDAARSAIRHDNANVTIVYRKKLENMPANKSEINEAIEEKINFIFEKNIIEIKEENSKIDRVILDNGETLKADIVVMAIGAKPNINYIKDFKIGDDGLVMIDNEHLTNIENVYAGGDITQNKSTVCMAVKNGKDAANFINKNLLN